MERREQSLGFQRGLLFIYFLLAGKLILCVLYVHTCMQRTVCKEGEMFHWKGFN